MMQRAALQAGLVALTATSTTPASARCRPAATMRTSRSRAATPAASAVGREARDELVQRAAARPARPARRDAASSARTSSGRLAERGAVGQRDGAVALGQARAVGPEHQRHVGVAGRAAARGRAPSQSWRGVESSRSAPRTTSPIALVGVVDDDREVVGARRRRCGAPRSRRRRPRRAPRRGPSKRDARRAGAHAQRRRAARGLALGALGRRQVAAGAGVGALGQRRRAGAEAASRISAPRAPAGVERARRPRGGRSRRVVERAALGLADDRAVPVEAERGEVGELLGLEARAATRPVSRSSTRTRKRAPAARANSQASSAVRRLPRCSAGGGGGEAAVGAHVLRR